MSDPGHQGQPGNQGRKPSEQNIFIANDIYQDATAIFSFRPKKLHEIVDTALFILDTNVLLVPYSISKNSLNAIGSAYKKLKEEGRLIIPGQVAREFAKNRALKLTQLFQSLQQERDKTFQLQEWIYPLLEGVEAYQRVKSSRSELDAKVKDYKKALGDVQDYIRKWTWDDPVSTLYNSLFDSSVVEEIDLSSEDTKKAIQADLHKCIEFQLPPGYKDAAKPDEGIGDLLIWRTILKVARERNLDVVFVSGEEKADWFYRSAKQALYPRYELIEEFRRETEGHTFHIIKLSDMLDLFRVDDDVVKEVEDQEAASVHLLHALIKEQLESKWPAFGAAQESARRASCQSNLKQLALAMRQYLQDNNERFPQADRWCDEIAPYILRTEELLRCPTSESPFGYSMNSNLSGAALNQITQTSRTVMLFDSNSGIRNAHDAGDSLPRPGRHLEMNNFAFADSHVMALRSDEEHSLLWDVV